MDQVRSRKLAHLSYVAPLVAVLVRAQAGEVLARGGYSAVATITLLVLLLLGGFGGALYALATSFDDPARRAPAVVGVVTSIAAVLYLTMSVS